MLAQGSFTITAGEDATGTATTDAVTVGATGCFTFVERGDASTTSAAIDWTKPGVPAETVLVRDEPTLVTRIHAQSAARGEVVFDLVTVSGTGGAVIPGRWKLLGLPAPREGGCAAIPIEQWAHAETLAQGRFEAHGDGTVRTAPVTLTRRLCVTYVEHGDATATTSEIGWTAPGLAAETMLVHGHRAPAAVPFVNVPAGLAGGAASPRPRAGGMPLGVAALAGTGVGVAALCGLARTGGRHHRRRSGRRG